MARVKVIKDVTGIKVMKMNMVMTCGIRLISLNPEIKGHYLPKGSLPDFARPLCLHPSEADVLLY